MQTCSALFIKVTFESANIILVGAWLPILLGKREPDGIFGKGIVRQIFFAPNTSDQELVARAFERLAENGVHQDRIDINYDMQQASHRRHLHKL